MLNFMLVLVGVLILVLFILVIMLSGRIDNLESKGEDIENYSYKVTLHSEPEELTQDEIKKLKEFIREYLRMPDVRFSIFEYPLRDIRPLHRHTWNDFKENEFNWLRDLVLYPDKLEEEQEKIKLKKEIEEKQKELSEME